MYFCTNFITLNTSLLQSLYAEHPGVKALLSTLHEPGRDIGLKGLTGSAASMVCASVFAQSKENHILCILNDLEEAGYFYHDCCQILNETDVLFFPSLFKRNIRYGQKDAANEILRTEVLSRLNNSPQPCLLITYPEALAEKVVSGERLKNNTLTISVNEKIDTAFVSDVLESYGFEWTDYVYEPGQYAVRGSIIDVFSFSNEYPYRIDFFGDEVESIRSFDVETQLSKERLETVSILSAQSDEGDATLLSYLPDSTKIVFRNEEWVYDKLHSLWNEAPVLTNEEAFASLEQIRLLLTPAEIMKETLAPYTRIHLSACHEGSVVVPFSTELQLSYHKNFEWVATSFREKMDEGYTLYILSNNEKQIKRIQSIFDDRGDNIRFTPTLQTLHEGFIDKTLRICLFTDHQLFDRYHKYNLKSEKARSGKIALSLKELQQFQPGDFLVHLDHGIGKFGGLLRTEMNGKMQEVIKMTFLNDDMIFVSIHNLHKISKYKGKENEPPRLNKLGSGAWENLKDRTKKKVKDIAKDLILLYSQRREEQGFAFSPDTYLQRELEASFIYEDTPDQLKATNDIKQDMESARPMDRLVCGDVGFGKTEVAIRAAFKAVVDGKQAAVLVPTTLLAFQHYNTFRERLADFPVTVDYLSRARTPKTTKEMLQKLKDGKIDILIGTHRLIGKDVRFKDLGLLIVDEEQKFGVSVKEKLKQLKVNVDTLTLTATPIPRTLQFSLMGARDLSNISTPPPNRYPIHTEVHRFSSDIIREAVNFEMSRNGQVFIINNRISNLQDLAALVKKEVPDARIAVGHGQMEPSVLEQIILDFANYEYDVLVATSIIENGIDIPNANTMIVNSAHRFGLSDLHQLRGRVGRSNHKAFCYLLSPPLSEITPEARRRLQAIENFSELGSGIHIAMQDLDIRGAGNMLGAEQSGFIADLGYETYRKILSEAVQELKNEEFYELYKDENEIDTGENYVTETNIESDLELLFPATYIPSDSERILLYRELDGMEDEAGIEHFRAKLQDRFGPIPEKGEELIRIVRLRRIAKNLGIAKIILKNGSMTVYLVTNPESPYYQSAAFDKLLEFAKKNSKTCRLSEKNNRRLLSIQRVDTVGKAVSVVEEISQQ
ncbi:MAG: transcription-repair coupling factor [Dysgonamonadaceae bacterium]|jgi:transcription-repair coupling factor (superfamily II helicase)|nr:transcription-repair coupling factor [Dysgonamonadaceae bacterium]